METLNSFAKGKQIALAISKHAPLTEIPFSFTFPSGKITALIGPNGSGKSTFLKSMIRENELSQGLIEFPKQHSQLNSLSNRELSKLLAFLPQEHHYPPEISVSGLLRLAFLPEAGYFRPLPTESDPRIQSMLVALGLNALANRPLRQLSTGERQRVFLGRALLQDASILLLDEPTNHLDPGGVSRFWKTLLEARKRTQIEILVSTHDLAFVKENVEWLCALKNGNLFYEGPTEDFFQSSRDAELFNQ